MSEQIVDLIEAVMPGPMGDVTPQALDARDRAEQAAERAETFAGQSEALQDQAVASLIANAGSSTREALEAVAKHMIVFGDSWSADEDGKRKWPLVVARQLGMQLDNYAVGGNHFVVTGSGGDFNAQLDRMIADFAGREDAIGRVFVQGIVNDHPWAYDDIKSAVNGFIAKFQQNFPDTVIEFLMMSCFYNTSAKYVGFMYELSNWLATLDNVVVRDLVGCCTPANMEDPAYHPTDAGHRQIAAKVINQDAWQIPADRDSYFTHGFEQPTLAEGFSVVGITIAADNRVISGMIQFKSDTARSGPFGVTDIIDVTANPMLVNRVYRGRIGRIVPVWTNDYRIIGWLVPSGIGTWSLLASESIQANQTMRVDLSQMLE